MCIARPINVINIGVKQMENSIKWCMFTLFLDLALQVSEPLSNHRSHSPWLIPMKTHFEHHFPWANFSERSPSLLTDNVVLKFEPSFSSVCVPLSEVVITSPQVQKWFTHFHSPFCKIDMLSWGNHGDVCASTVVYAHTGILMRTQTLVKWTMIVTR